MDLTEATLLIKKLLRRPVAYHRAFCEMTGKACAGVMLSQAWYWSSRTEDDGWFYKTGREWREETGLSRTEQETARKRLVSLGLMEEAERGMPCKMHFRVNTENVVRQLVENPHTVSRQGIRKLVSRKPANLSAGNPHTVLKIESTQEITTEIRERQPKPVKPGSQDALKQQAPRYSIAEIEADPAILERVSREVAARFPTVDFPDIFRQWLRARMVDGGVGRSKKADLVQYRCDMDRYFETYTKRRGNGNGYHKPSKVDNSMSAIQQKLAEALEREAANG